ncbi:hypothetical protein [Streptomyces fagopyri]
MTLVDTHSNETEALFEFDPEAVAAQIGEGVGQEACRGGLSAGGHAGPAVTPAPRPVAPATTPAACSPHRPCEVDVVTDRDARQSAPVVQHSS